MTQWSNNAVLTFLEAYKDEPALWDPSDDRYKDRAEVQETWRRLSQLLKIPVGDLKKKKESLMATYRYYVRKMRMGKNSTAGDGEGVYKPSWFAFKYMDQFLSKVYKGVDTLDTTRDEVEYSEFYIESSPIEQDAELPSTNTPDCHQRKTTRKRKKRRRPIPVQYNEVVSEPEIEEPSAVASRTSVTNRVKEESDDDCELYGKLLALKLRRLPEWQRQIVMYEMDGILLNKINQFKTSFHNSSVPSSSRIVKSPAYTAEESASE